MNEEALVNLYKAALTQFIGKPNNEDNAKAIKQSMVEVLKKFSDTLDLKAPLPKIDVVIEGRTAEFSLTDPKTGLPITLEEWVGKANSGFYD